jgi:hypothetical protein
MNYFGIDVHSTYHKVIGLTEDGEPLEYDIPNTREGKENLQEILLEHAPCAVTWPLASLRSFNDSNGGFRKEAGGVILRSSRWPENCWSFATTS